MDREGIGGNKPPSALQFGQTTIADMAAWFNDNPVIDREEVARDGKLQMDRVRSSIQELEDERKQQTDPINKQVKDINGRYALVRNPLEQVLDRLKSMLAAHLKNKQDAERKVLEEAKRVRDEAERIAREAEAAEIAAKAEADVGVADTKVIEKTMEADKAFQNFTKADRAVARAEHAVAHPKEGGGFRRAASLRTIDVPELVDWQLAIGCMGVTDKIREAILSEARGYNKVFGEWPDGIHIRQEQVVS